MTDVRCRFAWRPPAEYKHVQCALPAGDHDNADPEDPRRKPNRHIADDGTTWHIQDDAWAWVAQGLYLPEDGSLDSYLEAFQAPEVRGT